MPPAAARVVLAVLIALAGYLIARVCRYLAARFFSFAGRLLLRIVQPSSERLAQPGASTPDDSTSVAIAGAIVFWVVFPLFLLLALSVFGLPILAEWFEGLAVYLPNVLAAAATVLLGVLAGRFVKISLQATAGRMGFRRSEALARSAQITVIVLSVIVAVDQIGLDITLLVIITGIILAATLGGAALSFGLGARTAVANLIGCHYLSKWYRIGQTIRIGDVEGKIAHILPAAVVVQTRAGRVFVPAALFSERESILLDEEPEVE
ncbi:MAG: hypothetical protein R3338_01635 [Thermoanaerobaculia bacterium]|nr:hypothetical protein [Thermoanaerobaculia bacterium]